MKLTHEKFHADFKDLEGLVCNTLEKTLSFGLTGEGLETELIMLCMMAAQRVDFYLTTENTEIMEIPQELLSHPDSRKAGNHGTHRSDGYGNHGKLLFGIIGFPIPKSHGYVHLAEGHELFSDPAMKWKEEVRRLTFLGGESRNDVERIARMEAELVGFSATRLIF